MTCLSPNVPLYKPIGTVKIKPPITEFPSPDHDYSARPPSQPKSAPAPAPAPDPANNNDDDDLPRQLSSETAVGTEDPPPASPPAKKTGKKAGEATPRNRGKTGQTKRSFSKTMMTHQYENKEKNIIQKKGNNPKVKASI